MKLPRISGVSSLILFSIIAGSNAIAQRFVDGLNAYGTTFLRAGLGSLTILTCILLLNKGGELRLKYPIPTWYSGLGALLILLGVFLVTQKHFLKAS